MGEGRCGDQLDSIDYTAIISHKVTGDPGYGVYNCWRGEKGL
jgi:hypothetical protein